MMVHQKAPTLFLFSGRGPITSPFSKMKNTGQTPMLAKSALVLAFWALCALSLAECSQTSCNVQGTGTVRYFEMEGGFYGIDADSGGHYRPVNLPKDYAKDGLRIRFCAQRLEGIMSIHMWGIPVEIVEMKPFKPEPRDH
jgi:hypothetical protein